MNTCGTEGLLWGCWGVWCAWSWCAWSCLVVLGDQVQTLDLLIVDEPGLIADDQPMQPTSSAPLLADAGRIRPRAAGFPSGPCHPPRDSHTYIKIGRDTISALRFRVHNDP